MKKALILLALPLLLVACKSEVKKINLALPDTVKYPYVVDSTYNWEVNPKPENALVALSALKAEEKLDTAAFRKYFAKNIVINKDGVHIAGSVDQLQKNIQQQLGTNKSVKITVNYWQSLINKAKTQEVVTTWYTQYWVDKNGHADSVRYTDNNILSNGKITRIDEYMMRFPKGK
ncbi:hypothetical protein [Mucilaginibacter sp. KACC 22063]|uniref:hypothetical protein n=1 Tax=Mucilaginibacter sp. KACC 22063 TaxID=3025666 RepID=UPI0023655119|nr:hypothetical protein [Mucilaginibacter sp. KACC 22063]WDF54584.1 hypothetical protein PQ461_16755 [Mucilaginibacter sp. KACC 22063]